MEAMEYLLLAEESPSRIMDTICDALGIESAHESCLVITRRNYNLDICIAGVTMEPDTADFFRQQISRIYGYLETIPLVSLTARTATLERVQASSALVMLHYKENKKSLSFFQPEVYEITTALLEKFHGLHLSYYGQELLIRERLQAE